jgi:hypothetical protein
LVGAGKIHKFYYNLTNDTTMVAASTTSAAPQTPKPYKKTLTYQEEDGDRDETLELSGMPFHTQNRQPPLSSESSPFYSSRREVV